MWSGRKDRITACAHAGTTPDALSLHGVGSNVFHPLYSLLQLVCEFSSQFLHSIIWQWSWPLNFLIIKLFIFYGKPRKYGDDKKKSTWLWIKGFLTACSQRARVGPHNPTSLSLSTGYTLYTQPNTLDLDLTWTANTSELIKKTQRRLEFLRVLEKHNSRQGQLVSFYCCYIQSIDLFLFICMYLHRRIAPTFIVQWQYSFYSILSSY